MQIGRRRFHITIDLARLAVAGPFVLTARNGGSALGLAQFSAPSPIDCISRGVGAATLTAQFQTVSPLR
jgi:hypothetical protein